MQIVIEIPDELYKALLNGYEELYSRQLSDCVRNGTPLPKGHGRLIDADEYTRLFLTNLNYKINGEYAAPTIIEADKEGKDADRTHRKSE